MYEKSFPPCARWVKPGRRPKSNDFWEKLGRIESRKIRERDGVVMANM